MLRRRITTGSADRNECSSATHGMRDTSLDTTSPANSRPRGVQNDAAFVAVATPGDLLFSNTPFQVFALSCGVGLPVLRRRSFVGLCLLEGTQGDQCPYPGRGRGTSVFNNKWEAFAAEPSTWAGFASLYAAHVRASATADLGGSQCHRQRRMVSGHRALRRSAVA